MMAIFSLVLLISAANLFEIISAHVSLTFPPARKLDLDFLDFSGTKMPCGMPQGHFRTVLEAGSTVTITWHMANPHKVGLIGGLHLEILQGMGNSSVKLSTNPTGEMAQMYTVKIPDMPCDDCIIRLMQNINEAPVKGYGAYSCADIKIVRMGQYKEDCLWRGKADANSKCWCEKGYWGPRCQYKDECENDSDCMSPQGMCVDIGGTTLPRKQCYCAWGFHGEKCQWKNMDELPTPQNMDLSSYMKHDLSDRMWLYHKMITAKKEMEFILMVKGTSYGAIGWRPASIDQSCRSMPGIEDGYMDPMPMKNDISPFKLEKKMNMYTPTRPFHPMACSDMIIGTARGMYSRIRDYYTRDMSSPRLDTFYGGTEDITSAGGWESSDGVTTLIFRRKVQTADPTDHDVWGPMHVIWARGQDPGSTPMQMFFAQDELKYHGSKDMMQRGVTSINFA